VDVDDDVDDAEDAHDDGAFERSGCDRCGGLLAFSEMSLEPSIVPIAQWCVT
jgi:hypothetical protein